MLFMYALEKMTVDELRELVAFAEAATFTNLMKDAAGRSIDQSRKGAARAGQWTSRRVDALANWIDVKFPKVPKKLGGDLKRLAAANADAAGWLDHLAAPGNNLERHVEKSKSKLTSLTRRELIMRLEMLMTKMAGKPGIEKFGPEESSRAVLIAVAKHLGLDREAIAPEEIEEQVFTHFIQDLTSRLEVFLAKANPEQIQKLDDHLRQQIERMSAGDRKTIMKAMDIQNLSSKALLDTFKSGGAAFAILAMTSTTGFGVFLALTTMMKAVSLLFGFTFSFATYTAATTALGFILGPGMPIALAVAAGSVALLKRRHLQRALLTTIVATLHAKLLTTGGGK